MRQVRPGPVTRRSRPPLDNVPARFVARTLSRFRDGACDHRRHRFDRRFGLVSREIPLRLRKFPLRAITTRATMMDAGLAWLFGVLKESVEARRSERIRR